MYTTPVSACSWPLSIRRLVTACRCRYAPGIPRNGRYFGPSGDKVPYRVLPGKPTKYGPVKPHWGYPCRALARPRTPINA